MDGMDRFQVTRELSRLSVQSDRDELNYNKLLLKRALIEEILKIEDANKLHYQILLDSVLKRLDYKSQLYGCCLNGCRFEGKRHREYIKHLRTSHPRISHVICYFKHNCVRSFTTIEDLLVHIRQDHSAIIEATDTVTCSTEVFDTPLKCNMSSCGSKHFPNVKHLMTHFNSFHLRDARDCIFEDCDHKFGPFQESRKHFRNKHMLKSATKVKKHYLLVVPALAGGGGEISDIQIPDSHHSASEDDQIESDDDDYDVFNIDEIENCEPEDESDDYFMFYYADFLNRLAHFKFIPHSTCTEISDEYYRNSQHSQDIREKKLRQALGMVGNLSIDEVNKVVSDVVHDDFFLKAQKELNTEYKREKFVQEKFNYCSPMEILLNKSEVAKGLKNDIIHYVPLKDSIRALLEDKSYLHMMQNQSNAPAKDADKIEDIQDGTLYKTNKFFIQNPLALSLLFYSDGVEIVNPLGSARGTYKIVQVFYTLTNIPKYQRSKIDRLQLAMIFREKLLKTYPLSVIYERLVKDLLALEEGILVNIPDPTLVKIGLLVHAADNLEAHQLGGYSGSFSSKSVCRWCHIQYEDLEENIHD